jgi:lysine 2,3-aminomutase
VKDGTREESKVAVEATSYAGRAERETRIRDWREVPLWRDVPQEKWEDWRWQAGHAIKSLEDLRQVITPTPEEERGVLECAKFFRFAIPPYYASLMDPDDPNCPVRLQAVPQVSETVFSRSDIHDPLGEDSDSPAPGLTHRYPDRVLLLITDYCGMYCRFCTRRRFVAHDHGIQSLRSLEPAFQYLEKAKEVRDVLLSGGDSLMVSDGYLESVLKRLREIEHIEIVRIGSKVPCTTPQRITPELVAMLKRYHPLWLNTHFNHPKEITPEASKALALLADAGIPLGCQTVLLRGVNDCPTIMKRLMHKLVMNRVRPYYIYQCDLSEGIEHFRTRVSTGIEIMEHLRGHTSGYAVPTFVVDAPGGGGKIPVGPNYLISQSDKKVVLRNYEGGIFSYPEPDAPASRCPDNCVHCQEDERASREGVAGILANVAERIVPANTLREKRRRERPTVVVPVEMLQEPE